MTLPSVRLQLCFQNGPKTPTAGVSPWKVRVLMLKFHVFLILSKKCILLCGGKNTSPVAECTAKLMVTHAAGKLPQEPQQATSGHCPLPLPRSRGRSSRLSLCPSAPLSQRRKAHGSWGGGPYEGAWDGGWHTLVITAQVCGEGDEVAAGPGAGQGTRRAVGALGPFLPLTDVSQVHGSQLPRSHREDGHQLLQEGRQACHPSSQGACRPRVRWWMLVTTGDKVDSTPALRVARELRFTQAWPGINPCSWKEEHVKRREEPVQRPRGLTEPGVLKQCLGLQSRNRVSWGRGAR